MPFLGILTLKFTFVCEKSGVKNVLSRVLDDIHSHVLKIVVQLKNYWMTYEHACVYACSLHMADQLVYNEVYCFLVFPHQKFHFFSEKSAV